MLNRVILMGRLTANPELKTTGSGVNVTSFTIAVDRNYVKNGEERKADFINVVCWRQTAEFVCRYFSKGSLIAVDGQLQSRTYQVQDGTNRYVVEVVADQVSFTGERRENNGGGQPSQTNNNGYAVDRNYVNSQQGQPPQQNGYSPQSQQPQPQQYQGMPDYADNNYDGLMPDTDDLPF